MTEQWIKWEPLPGLARLYDIDKVSYTLEGLSILLSEFHENNAVKVRVTFTEIEAHRSTYETFRIKNSKFHENGTFFKIENSEYVTWLSEQGYSNDNSSLLIHVAIATEDTVLDIIATQEPTVQFVHE